MTHDEKMAFFQFKENQYAKQKFWIKSVCNNYSSNFVVAKSSKCIEIGKFY